MKTTVQAIFTCAVVLTTASCSSPVIIKNTYQDESQWRQMKASRVVALSPLISSLLGDGGISVASNSILPDLPKSGLLYIEGDLNSLGAGGALNISIASRFPVTGVPMKWAKKFSAWCESSGGFIQESSAAFKYGLWIAHFESSLAPSGFKPIMVYNAEKDVQPSVMSCFDRGAWEQFHQVDRIAELTLLVSVDGRAPTKTATWHKFSGEDGPLLGDPGNGYYSRMLKGAQGAVKRETEAEQLKKDQLADHRNNQGPLPAKRAMFLVIQSDRDVLASEPIYRAKKHLIDEQTEQLVRSRRRGE